MTGIMCWPRYSPFFFSLCSRQRCRFSSTSRIPTVIWVGRSSSSGTGCRTGSRTLTIGASQSVVQDLSPVIARGDAAEHDAELVGLHQLQIELGQIGRVQILDARHAVTMLRDRKQSRDYGGSISR